MLTVRVFTEIPWWIRDLLDDVADPLKRKMLYVLYKMSKDFITLYNRWIWRITIWNILSLPMDWTDFQCAVNCLIVLAK